MKKVVLSTLLLGLFLSPFLCIAEEGSWGKYGNSPEQILNEVVKQANDDYKIQQTALDGVTDTQGSYDSQYKIANTLDRLRKNINPYLQWMVYIGLSVAVILLIYTGLLMVTNSLHGEGDMAKLKKRFIYIAVGVLLLTGFYAIIKIGLGLLNSLLGI